MCLFAWHATDFVWSDGPGTVASPAKDTVAACQAFCASQPNAGGLPMGLMVPGSVCVCKWTTAIPWNPLSTGRAWITETGPAGSQLAIPNGATINVECNPGSVPYGSQTCNNGVLTGSIGCRANCAVKNEGILSKFLRFGRCFAPD